MEIISSKQEEGFKATTIVVNILRLHTNPKVLIQEFIWKFEVVDYQRFRPGGVYLGQVLRGMCRWPLSTPTPL